MDDVKMAQFISELRKSKKMTQKDLAGHLGVTDKAVSKWERGISCPDISLLASLAGILDVTVGELLKGEKMDPTASEVELIVETTLQYADTATKNRSRNIRLLCATIISTISLLGILVCIICDFAIAGRLTWSLFPICSIIFTWLVIMPILVWSKNGTFLSLTLFSLFLIPFLLILEWIIGIDRLIMPLGIPISILSILYLWVIYLLFTKSKLKKYVAVAVTFILGLPISYGINSIVGKFTGQPTIDIWDVLTYSLLVISSFAIFVAGSIRSKKIMK
jgi:transcriptional regulator with XRE-family HTH domain